MKQVGLTGGTGPPSSVALAVGEVGQPADEVGPVVVVAKVTHNSSSSVLAKRKRDNVVRPSSCKKSKAPISLCALRQVVGLMSSAGRPSTTQDVPPTPLGIEASTVAAITPVTPASSPPPVVVVQKVTPTAVEVIVLATQADSTVALSFTVATPLPSANVETTGTPTVLPPSSSAPMASPSTILAVRALPRRGRSVRNLRKSCFCTRRRLWRSMKKDFKRPLGRLVSLRRTLT